MNPGTFVTLLIFAWLLLAAVTLWALLRVPLRRAKLHRQGEPQAAPVDRPTSAVRKRHLGWPLWNR